MNTDLVIFGGLALFVASCEVKADGHGADALF
jgi:hypothetical protein